MYNAYQIGGTYTFQLFNENDEMILSSDSIVEIVNRCIKDKVPFTVHPLTHPADVQP